MSPEPGWGPKPVSEGARLGFPLGCRFCGEDDGTSPICEDCRREVLEASHGACPRCAQAAGPFSAGPDGCASCRGRPLGFDAAVALGPYSGPLRHLCLSIKHVEGSWLVPWLADVLAEAHASIRESLGERGCVVGVPLHWRRFLVRGYNQAEELARSLARRLALPDRSGALVRRRSTRKLAGLSLTERREALKGAFRVKDRWADEFAGRAVLLVDDVLTTGATCGAAARALKRAGADRVLVAVVARAERLS